ncbi:MAG: YdcF family protein [Clostridia bacterium]|nr:YdcF family protein [Clostridia bacterium]
MVKYNYIVWRILIIVLGTALIVNGLLLFFRTNFNLGNVLTAGLGIAFLLYAIYFDWVHEKFPKWLKIILSLGISAVVLFSSFLFIYGLNDNVDYKEDAFIVLGAAVQGDTPSLALADRLDATVKYHKQNPSAVIVVSGGKGPQENVTEAYAMEKYLVTKGIPQNKIVKEEKATSTYENFLFSKEILDNTFDGEYSIAYVSNEYHIYRAGGIAKSVGFTNITHIHCGTRWYSVVTGTLRECLAVLKFCILD